MGVPGAPPGCAARPAIGWKGNHDAAQLPAREGRHRVEPRRYLRREPAAAAGVGVRPGGQDPSGRQRAGRRAHRGPRRRAGGRGRADRGGADRRAGGRGRRGAGSMSSAAPARKPLPPAPSAPCCPPPSTRLPGTGTNRAVARIALVGNPNVGKSTLFNAMTGARQHVGNWPGKTAAVAFGGWRTPMGPVELIDLPGTYSLEPHSPDEELTRDLLVTEDGDRPDLVIAVLDAANLARNLYLLAQLLDTGVRLVVALTMLDVAAGRGVEVDALALARLVGVPVVKVCPRLADGLDRLADE